MLLDLIFTDLNNDMKEIQNHSLSLNLSMTSTKFLPASYVVSRSLHVTLLFWLLLLFLLCPKLVGNACIYSLVNAVPFPRILSCFISKYLFSGRRDVDVTSIFTVK